MPEIIVKLGDRVVQKYLLYKDQKLSVGRAPDNDIAIENPAVSRRHATVQMVDGRYILEDNNSANGTYVNGVRVTRTEILDKDIITVGKHKLHFYNQDVVPVQVVSPRMDEGANAVPGGGTSSPAAALRIAQGKQKDQLYPLTKVETRIGRAADNDIRLHDWFVSKHHAVIGKKGAVFVIRDLDSWRHTMVNGAVIQEAVLKHGDEIQFGPKISMKFELGEGAQADEGGGRRPVELASQSSGSAEAGEHKEADGAATPVPEDMKPEGVVIEPMDEKPSGNETAAADATPAPETVENILAAGEKGTTATAEAASEQDGEEAAEDREASSRRRRRRKRKRHDRGEAHGGEAPHADEGE
ncbi:FHA domain-containing protein, partial [Candidatus Sumerlaeota bacterium]|nr:FHA domain-containing protein [Candidatus Sumerlaeota bacterium]